MEITILHSTMRFLQNAYCITLLVVWLSLHIINAQTVIATTELFGDDSTSSVPLSSDNNAGAGEEGTGELPSDNRNEAHGGRQTSFICKLLPA